MGKHENISIFPSTRCNVLASSVSRFQEVIFLYNTSMISNDLLAILCCPETKQDLVAADPSLVEKLNQKVERRELKTRAGETVTQKLEGGLIRADRQFLYAIRSDIPIMLIDESIPLAGLL